MNNEIIETLISNIKNQIKKTKERDFALCIEQWEQLFNYITNLQEENKRLHNQYDLMENSLDDKQELIDKAIEYIETLKTYPFLEKYYIKDLLDILRGKDEKH